VTDPFADRDLEAWADEMHAWNAEPTRVARVVLANDGDLSLHRVCGCSHPRGDHGSRGTNHTGRCTRPACGCARFHVDATYTRVQEYTVEASQDQHIEED
jgi:hypothetical protein